MITHEYLKEILHYEESTGHFYWKKRLSIRVSIGALAGHVSKVSGYVELRIHGSADIVTGKQIGRAHV